MRKTSGGGSKLLWFGGRRLVVQRGEVGGDVINKHSVLKYLKYELLIYFKLFSVANSFRYANQFIIYKFLLKQKLICNARLREMRSDGMALNK